MILNVENLHAHYGKSHILHGVNFLVRPNEIVSLLGRNGSGRSTTMKAIMGLVPPTEGSVLLDGAQMAGLRPEKIARSGLAYVPEERLAFTNLTVDENLRMGEQIGHPGMHCWSREDMYNYFPRLRERRNNKAGHLSGGEQQMLTICRSLLGNPKVILIDEPTEGLAPKIVQVVMEVIIDIRSKGVAVILVEQKLTIALRCADRVLVMGHGEIVFNDTPEALDASPNIRRDWLEVS